MTNQHKPARVEIEYVMESLNIPCVQLLLDSYANTAPPLFYKNKTNKYTPSSSNLNRMVI